MILTVTLNPSIDIAYTVTPLHLDTVNRVAQVRKTAGGKGLNVTRVLHQSGAQVMAAGFLGGVLGQAIEEWLDATGIEHHFAPIAGETRNCIAVLHEGQQTELLEAGPHITAAEAAAFVALFDSLLPQVTVVVLSGSLPQGLPHDFYVTLLERCHAQGKAVVLDCSGAALRAVLASPYSPTAIKPNAEELAQLLAMPIGASAEEIRAQLNHPLFDGIEWLVVSRGAEGAIAKNGATTYRVSIPTITVQNAVGSGDATVAGVAAALANEASAEHLLRHANALGMLNAMEEQTGCVNMTHYQNVFDRITVQSLH